MRIKTNESTYSTQLKLLVNGLVYIELLQYDESKDFKWEKFNFNKTTLNEYWEAKKFIRKYFHDIKENIEKELFKLFNKIATHKQNLNKTKNKSNLQNLSPVRQSLALMNSTSRILKSINPQSLSPKKCMENNLGDNGLFICDSTQLQKNFKEYLKWKKFEVIEQIMVFQEFNENKIENTKVLIADFLQDEDFKIFLKDLKKKKEDYLKNSESELNEEISFTQENIMNEENISTLKEVKGVKSNYFLNERDEINFGEEDSLKRIQANEKLFNKNVEIINFGIKEKIKEITQEKKKFQYVQKTILKVHKEIENEKEESEKKNCVLK